jgi:hypothetical protein
MLPFLWTTGRKLGDIPGFTGTVDLTGMLMKMAAFQCYWSMELLL